MTDIQHQHITESANKIITEKFGISFTPENLHNLHKSLVNTARELGFHKDIEMLTELIRCDQLTTLQAEILISNLTVGETFFFRDTLTLNTVRDNILKPLIEERRDSVKSLRIWSAACCSGEEPYTLAIMLMELIQDLKNWDLKILATDLNPKFLEKAKKGIYTSWSFRNTNHEITDKYFIKKGNTLELIPEIRNMVTFLPLNLVSDVPDALNHLLHSQDIIFCRNVLMYFAPDQALKVSGKLFSSLCEKGWLVISPVESSIPVYSAFRPVMMNGITLFQKNLHQKLVAETLPERHFSYKPPSPAPLPKTPVRYAGKSVKLKPGDQQAQKVFAKHPEQEPAGNVTQEFTKGNYSRVIELILNHKDSGPPGRQLLTLLARSYANLGNLESAGQVIEDLIRLDKTDAWPYYFYAAILQEMNLLEEAEVKLRKALYLDPGHLLSHFLLGTISGKLGKQIRAKKHYLNARELLAGRKDDEMLPESEGMTAGRLKEILDSLI